MGEPAEEATEAVESVWRESTTIYPGFLFSITSKRDSNLVSQNISIFDVFSPSLSALIFTWDGDSSPDTYKTDMEEARDESIWIIIVDFPIPGSPPTNTAEGLMTPPPRTLSNSAIPEETLIVFSYGISESFLTVVSITVVLGLDTETEAASTSSKLFQLPHSGHFPAHFVSSCPHSLQTYLKLLPFISISIVQLQK